jgi:hypothetical protein
MRFRILPYRQGSKGAKALADALGGKVLKLQGSSYQVRPGDALINWGNTQPTSQVVPSFQDDIGARYFNYPQLIKTASNKKEFFNALYGGGLQDLIPSFWLNAADIPDDAFPVVCRTVLAGHSGDGIVIAASRDNLVPAPLYVSYVKKTDEYRIHVGRRGLQGEIISIQKKKRRLDHDSPNWQVRNHQNGFVYAREGVVPPTSITAVSVRALLATGLDFGAVDVIWNQQQERPYVLEINTAPGLEGTTVEDYARFFRNL